MTDQAKKANIKFIKEFIAPADFASVFKKFIITGYLRAPNTIPTEEPKAPIIKFKKEAIKSFLDLSISILFFLENAQLEQ